MTGVLSAQSPKAAARPVSHVRASGAVTLVPNSDQPIAWPADFGRRFVIFADVEEEFDWLQPLSSTHRDTTAATALPEASDRFNAAGVVPSYLVDYPIVNNEASAAIIAQLHADGKCDVGTQLHPWVTPPMEEEVSNFNSFTGNLPPELQRAKLKALTNKIASVTGEKPLVYRAGRYGLGSQTMTMLAEEGYRLDVSVRSCFDYSDRGGADYRDYPLHAWRVSDRLFELPLTTAWTGRLRNHPKLFETPWLRSICSRTGLLSRVPLTPEGIPLVDALQAIAALDDDGLQMFSLSFHSPSLVPGHTPYVRCETELLTFWRWWDGVFNEFARRGILPIRQGDIIAAADGAVS